tara:strand:- start:8841 stop:9476 length:636 start_codon:yes stop_codon:yes gene_type:complete
MDDIISEPSVIVYDDHDLAFLDIPYNDSNEFHETFSELNKEVDFTKLTLKEFENLRKVADFDVFAISKNPYQRAFEMFKGAIIQNKEESKNISNFGIGKYFEEVLNNWNEYKSDKIITQTQVLGSVNKHSDIQLFKCENLYNAELHELNELLEEHGLRGIRYFRRNKIYENFINEFDDLSFEVINYIFIDDFTVCDYTKQNEIHTRKLSGG